MEIIKAELKQVVEECKRIARDSGLSFQDETLEFVTTNEDMIRLSPKGMIPTLYDFWVNDVYVLQDKGKYDLYPHNPYETVVNTRPPLSFYNDNNPDWLNIMIFYHVIAHIDFFQNNIYFRRTWLDDFLGKALAQANIIKELRYERGRWVDYVIEFARGIDNLVDYYGDLNSPDQSPHLSLTQRKFTYFFDEFLQNVIKASTFKFMEELDRYNQLAARHDEETAKNLFLVYVGEKYLDFTGKFDKSVKAEPAPPKDLLAYLIEYSPHLNKDENEWMKSVVSIVRETSLYFQPQIRTKILNEGWASYWHEKLFQADPRLRTHEIEYSKINSFVVSLPRVGMNPYAIGLRLFKFLEAKADRGMLSFEFEKIRDMHSRKEFDGRTGAGRDFIFDLRRYYSDATAINQFIDQDFVNEFKVFVTGKRLNKDRTAWEYYVKSKKASAYRQKMLDSLYHPPLIRVDHEQTSKTEDLHLIHVFEGKELVREYVANTMLGIEFLWGRKVTLLTHEIDEEALRRIDQEDMDAYQLQEKEIALKFNRVKYSMENRKLSREVLGPMS
jgi:stage V sporulation protein R